MKVGTKTLLWGVHCAAWHPITIVLAWRRLFKRWPNWQEAVAIFFHDWGYWGLSNIDGEEGKKHPHKGASLAASIVRYFAGSGPGFHTYIFTVTHSRDAAARLGLPPSPLYIADKVSIFYDPPWFYLLRARLSGEIHEFRQHAIDTGHIPAGATDREWLNFYRNNVANRPEIKKLL